MARVLVVDDAAFMRQAIRRVLTDAGHQVAGEAENGEEAVQRYEQLMPDVVTMDITMPVMDGLEALSRIQALDPDSVVIMCSALGQQEMVVDAIHRGAREFIVKPFQPARVVQALSATLGH